MRNYINLTAILTMLMPVVVAAGPHTAGKNKACPDVWALTDKVIPEIRSNTNPWGIASGDVDDKEIAKTHLSSARPIQTIDKLPITNVDLVDDLLTVASECLVYRNFEADTWNYVAPPAVTPVPSNGWMTVVVF